MENNNKQRRSSILKPQKTRNPLTEVDLGSEDPDDQITNITKTSRRVSFASNNLIKPFVADAEQNTIWELTYEESIQTCESSQSMCDNPGRDKENTNLNVTMTADDNAAIDLDLTPNIDVGNFNINVRTSNTTCDKDNINESDMEFTSIVNNIGNINFNSENISIITDDMEFTSLVNTNVKNVDIFETSMEETEMISGIVNVRTQEVSSLTENILSQPGTLCTSCDDTQNLINYSLGNGKKSDFSKVMANESFPLLFNLQSMPLRGINSTSFVQDFVKEVKHSNVDKTSEPVEDNYSDVDMEMSIEYCIPQIIINGPSKTEVMTVENERGVMRCNIQNESNEKLQFIQVESTVEMPSQEHHNNAAEEPCIDTQIEENSIVELCTKLMEEGTLLLSDSSDVSLLQNSPPSVKPASETNLMVQKANSLFLDQISPMDLSWTNDLLNKAKAIRTRAEKLKKHYGEILDQYSSFIKLKIEDIYDKTKLIREIRKFEKYVRNRQREIDRNGESVVKNKCSEELPEPVNNEPEILTWKEKVLRLHERSEKYWKIISLDSNSYQFNTLFKTIQFNVSINEEDGQVLNIELKDCISEQSGIIALYVQKAFMEKLKLKPIQSALGEKFEILSLLDYVRLTMENLLRISNDFSYLSRRRAVCIDPAYKITFSVISVELIQYWNFTIDASDYENIGPENVTYHAKIGQLREWDIKKCMGGCPKGLAFIRAFVESLYNLIEQLENNKFKKPC